MFEPQEWWLGTAGDKLQQRPLLFLTESLHHLPEGGYGGVGQLVAPGVLGVSLNDRNIN